MILKSIMNKEKRDVTIGKRYPMFLKNGNKITIIDDFGMLSNYEIEEFDIVTDCTDSYNDRGDSCVFKKIDYPDFLEKYYNDSHNEWDLVRQCRQEIYNEMSDESKVSCLTSDWYTDFEKHDLIVGLSTTLNEDLVTKILIYMKKQVATSYEIDDMSLIYYLDKLHRDSVDDFFIDIMTNDVVDPELKAIAANHFEVINGT